MQMSKLTDAIKHLIIINIIMFVAPLLLNMDLTNLFALHLPKNEHFGFWQFLSHLFMHGGSMHLIFNMYGLWAFGTPLEQMWGKNKFLFFYFSSGIGAGLIYSLINYYQFNSVLEQLIGMGVSVENIQNFLDTGSYGEFAHLITLDKNDLTDFFSLYHTPAVGASGAIYGILVAFALTFPNVKLALLFFPVPISAKYFVPFIILSDLFFGLTKYSIGNIAHFAHIGGAAIGFLIAWYWKKNQFRVY